MLKTTNKQDDIIVIELKNFIESCTKKDLCSSISYWNTKSAHVFRITYMKYCSFFQMHSLEKICNIIIFSNFFISRCEFSSLDNSEMCPTIKIRYFFGEIKDKEIVLNYSTAYINKLYDFSKYISTSVGLITFRTYAPPSLNDYNIFTRLDQFAKYFYEFFSLQRSNHDIILSCANRMIFFKHRSFFDINAESIYSFSDTLDFENLKHELIHSILYKEYHNWPNEIFREGIACAFSETTIFTDILSGLINDKRIPINRDNLDPNMFWSDPYTNLNVSGLIIRYLITHYAPKKMLRIYTSQNTLFEKSLWEVYGINIIELNKLICEWLNEEYTINVKYIIY